MKNQFLIACFNFLKRDAFQVSWVKPRTQREFERHAFETNFNSLLRVPVHYVNVYLKGGYHMFAKPNFINSLLFFNHLFENRTTPFKLVGQLNRTPFKLVGQLNPKRAQLALHPTTRPSESAAAHRGPRGAGTSRLTPRAGNQPPIQPTNTVIDNPPLQLAASPAYQYTI